MTSPLPPTQEQLDATIDEARLREIVDEAKAKSFAGTLTKDAFDELWKQGLEAVGGESYWLGSLEMFRPSAKSLATPGHRPPW